MQRYESTFDRVDTKAYALDLHEYTEELHKKDKRTFLFSGAACLFLTIFAVVNAFDSNEILLSRIFGLVASAFVLLFAHVTCSTLKKQHDDPERVFEMCCEDSGLNERTEHAHHAIQCHIKDIRRFLELGT
ncbi:hypothetical protein J6S39_00985 [Candidatus Saccharibacteria bacterium]|nr:hypothetical protein [Candidatus Saccharibacteria bacterium]